MAHSTTHSIQIDVLKGLAIISVILLHSWDNSFLLMVGTPYYISQAVPIFIVIAAYNGVNSYIRSNAVTLAQCFSNTYNRFNRILLPYCIYLIIDCLAVKFFDNISLTKTYDILASINFTDAFLFFVAGGNGAGSYFIPVFIQLIFTLPILYSLARKNVMLMLVTAFIVDIAFEIYALEFDMPGRLYERIYIRYLSAAALGIWLVFGINRIWLLIGSAISVIYITAVNYWKFIPPLRPSWGSQNALSFMWPLAIIVIGLRVLPSSINNSYTWFIAEIGKASYHIYLIQMIYFWTIGELINKFLGSFIINLVVCVSIGLIFYYILEKNSYRSPS